MIFLPVEILAGYLGSAIGIPTDQAKVLLWLFIHVGLGFAYRKIKGPLERELYGMIIGTSFIWSMYGVCRLFIF